MTDTNKTLEQLFRKPNRKYKLFNHFNIDVPNQTHQIDILFLTTDKYKRKNYKYTICLIDCASRYKAARPLTNKYASDILDAIKDMYVYMKLIHI